MSSAEGGSQLPRKDWGTLAVQCSGKQDLQKWISVLSLPEEKE